MHARMTPRASFAAEGPSLPEPLGKILDGADISYIKLWMHIVYSMHYR